MSEVIENKTKSFYNTTIPSDWEEVKLGDMIDKIVGGGTPSREKAEYWNGDIYWATVKDFTSYNLNSTEETITELGLKSSSSNLIPKGTLITATRMALGKVMEYNIDVAINQDLKAIFPNIELDTKFLFYWFQKNTSVIEGLGNGSTVKGITLADLKGIKFYKVPLPEQKAIAHILGLMDSAINQNNQLIAQKELRKKWLMQNLLTGKKRLKSNGEWKMDNGAWESVRLGDVFEFVKTYSISREGLTKSKKENLIYCIHYGDIHAFYESDFLDFATQQSIPQIIDGTLPINEKDYLKEGDIILADASEDYQGVGEVVEVVNIESKTAVGGLHTIVLRGDPEIIANCFRGYLFASESVRNVLRKMATGSSVYSVTRKTLHNLPLLIPISLEEQTAIAQVLQAADKEIKILKRKTELLRAQKKGMMQVLLTGKKRLMI